MKKVTFTKYGMKNFCIFRENIELEIANGKLILICGPNGTGKTTTLDAIPFALFGSTSKGLRGDSVVNDTVGKNCHVWVEFSVTENETTSNYRVDRYQKDSKLGSTVLLRKDNTIIKKGSKEYTPFIENLLIPQKLFFNSLFFGQKVKNFFTDLPDSEQKEIFRKILKLDEYIDYYDKCKEMLSSLERESVNKSIEIGKLEQLIQTYEQKIKDLNEQKNEFVKNKNIKIDNINKQILDTKEKLIKIQDVLKKYSLEKFEELYEEQYNLLHVNKNSIADISKNLTNINKDIDNKYSQKKSELQRNYETKKYEIENQILVIDKEISDKRNELKLEQQEEINELKNAISATIAKIKVYENEIEKIIKEKEEYLSDVLNSDICPTCHQKITEECKKEMLEKEGEFLDKQEKLEQQIENLKYDNGELNGKIKTIEINFDIIIKEFIDEKSKIKNTLNLQMTDLKNKINIFYEKLNQMYSEELKNAKNIKEIQKQDLLENEKNILKEMEKFKGYIQKYKEYQSLVTEILNNIKILENNLENEKTVEFDIQIIEGFNKEKTKMELDLKTIGNSLNSIEEDKEIIEFWKTAFSSKGIPSMLIDNAIPFMNRQINTYLEKISNGRILVSIDTLKETSSGEFRDKISISVLDTHTKANARQKLSGGQIRQVDIATLLTLYDLQSNIYQLSCNIMIFDEIFDSLDDNNIGLTCGVLRQLCVDKCVMLISHRHVSQIEYDDVLEFSA